MAEINSMIGRLGNIAQRLNSEISPEDRLEAPSSIGAGSSPSENPMAIRWVVVFKPEVQPVEVFPFEDETSARALYEHLKLNWTEVLLCQVVEGPLHD